MGGKVRFAKRTRKVSQNGISQPIANNLSARHDKGMQLVWRLKINLHCCSSISLLSMLSHWLMYYSLWISSPVQSVVVCTSNVTGRHRGPTLFTEYHHNVLVLFAVSHIAYWTSSVSVTHVMFFIVSWFLCAMRVFEVQASSSPLVPNFVSVGLPLLSWPTYSINYSLTQLIWCARNWRFRFGINKESVDEWSAFDV